MDDEGYPLEVDPRASMQRWNDRNNSVDQESGEATGQKVVVLRKTKPDTKRSRARRSHRPHLQTFYYEPGPRSSQILLLQDFFRVPPLWNEYEFSLPEHIHQPFTNQESESTRTVTKVPFRVPQPNIDVKQRNEKEVTITVWREFCRGILVYEDVNATWNDLKDNCLLWPHMQALFGDFAALVPLSCVMIIRAVLLILKVFVPWIGVQLAYLHLFYVHLKIHMKGEKRGVRPVFIGGPSQGPLIYSIRHLSCPYCRDNKQCKATLRYFDTLLRERQAMTSR